MSNGLPFADDNKMAGIDAAAAAIKNRSLRTIRTELEFLTDSAVITPQQLSAILSQLPDQTQLHAPIISAAASNGVPVVNAPQPPVSALPDTSSNEKQSRYFDSTPSQAAAPPPAYGAAPELAMASALYAYAPADAGDVVLQPNDRVAVLEYVNDEWWKGRNVRTGQEGIFPRSYVKVVDEKRGAAPASNYGNMPLDVSQSGSAAADPAKPSKVNEAGKKFGKKMGNAAIFGAGATIGSNIVNGIF
ncbi:MAG: hypothetical protein M1832_002598 [Thelocarpon impressellum]|nr:MAG: hypothetical protein M1832_002598 [Thelocarpon impressellum]